MEVELKAKAPRGIEKKLAAAGAKKKSTSHQFDTIYDKPGEPLGKKGATLRVREEDGKTILTYKSKSKSKRVKAKEETELRVMRHIHIFLKGLGYIPIFTKEKTRTEYSLNSINVHLDKVKGLGTWLEFEAFGRAEPCRKKIVETAAILGIPEEKLSTESYIHLIREKLKSTKKQK